MDGLFSKMGVDKLGYALTTSSVRNDVISQNIANVDTPGYKAKDLKFFDVMNEYLGDGKKLPLTRTNEKHLPPADMVMDPSSFVYDQNNPSVRNDGNDVNEDYEMSQLAENSVRYQMLSQMTAGKFTKLKEIIQSR
ncbi:MAG: flagellar basal body rod protein FlgB [Deferribacterales bacterium]